MDDRQLLEMAARAAGMEGWVWSHSMDAMRSPARKTAHGDAHAYWNPLTDGGDALRLAATLEIDVLQRRSDPEVWAQAPMRPTICEPIGNDRTAATRRAITRAAASIGAKGERTNAK